MPGKHHETMPQLFAGEITELTCTEICTICHVEPGFIEELIAYGTLDTHGAAIEVFRFNAAQLRVVQTAARLYHDLEVNHAGIALAIDLMDEIEKLRQQVAQMDKFFKSSGKSDL